MIFSLALAASTFASCDFDTAQRVGAYDLLEAHDELIDQCVQTEGYISGNVFFADLAGMYRFGAANRIYEPSAGWFGLYLTDDGDWPNELRSAAVVGRVSTCERDREAAVAQASPGSIVMMTGYCHYRGGVTLRNAKISAGEAPQFTRQFGEENRLQFGDLSRPLTADDVPTEVRSLFDRYFAALRDGNVEVVDELVGPWSQNEDEINRVGFARYFAGLDGSPFAVVKENGTTRPIRYFAERRRTADGDAGTDQIWFGCFCVEDECDGRWPISELDATASEGPPYLCVRAFYENRFASGQHVRGWVLAADPSVETFPEPSNQ